MEEISIAILRNNAEGFLCEQQTPFVQVLVHAIRRKGLNDFFGELFFELEAVDIETAVVFLRKDEVNDLVAAAHDFLEKRHSFREAEIVEDVVVDEDLAALEEMPECDSRLEHLTDGIVILEIQCLNQQVACLLHKLLVARVVLKRILAGSGQSDDFIAALLRNLQILIASYFHHLHIFNDDLALGPIRPLEMDVLLEVKIVGVGKKVVLIAIGLDGCL